MKCTILNAHLFNDHIIDSSACSCGESVEDELHYFFVRSKYAHLREQLHANVSEHAIFNLYTVLHGRDNLPLTINHLIFDTVFKYMSDSSRFDSQEQLMWHKTCNMLSI